jgi:hypothetical protein
MWTGAAAVEADVGPEALTTARRVASGRVTAVVAAGGEVGRESETESETESEAQTNGARAREIAFLGLPLIMARRAGEPVVKGRRGPRAGEAEDTPRTWQKWYARLQMRDGSKQMNGLGWNSANGDYGRTKESSAAFEPGQVGRLFGARDRVRAAMSLFRPSGPMHMRASYANATL